MIDDNFKIQVEKAKNKLNGTDLSSMIRLIENFNGKVKEIDVKKWNFIKNGDGMISKCYKDDCDFIIKIPSEYIEDNIENLDNKKSFVLAHELGHYFLHMQDTDEFYDTKTFRRTLDFKDIIEIEAEYFAYNLFLGSKESFKYYVNSLDMDKEDKLKAISNKYNLNTNRIIFICGVWDIEL